MAKKKASSAAKRQYNAPVDWTKMANNYVAYIQSIQSKVPNLPGNTAQDLAAISQATAAATAASADATTKESAAATARAAAQAANASGFQTFEEKREYAETYAKRNNLPWLTTGLKPFVIHHKKKKAGGKGTAPGTKTT